MVVHPTDIAHGALVKEHLAGALKHAIMQGRLLPGQRVIEGKWAMEFGVAQASVREAINLLISEGFLVKDSGRSARVVNYREQDVVELYQVRGSLEALAAHLAAAGQPDLSRLESAYEAMKHAADQGDMRALIERDFDFHTALAEASGNPVLVEMLRRLLSPLFAFILIRVLKSGQGPQAWSDDLPRHRRIIEIIREGNGVVAAQYVQHAVSRFAASAYRVWENVDGAVEAHSRGDQRRKTKAGS
jgi:DNA-binding GntR family transcriptional regulator